jgi:hypothetical protein
MGVRLGVGFPFGTVDSLSGDTLGATVAALVPVWLDFGARIGRHFYVGPYLALGPGPTGSGLQGLSGLYILDARFGLNAQCHLLPRERLDPWFGLGAGYEWLQIEGSSGGDGGGSRAPGISGWEILNLQGGLDFGRQHGLGVGPFVSLSLSEYTPGGRVLTSYSVAGVQPQATLHEWLVIGVRVAFDLAAISAPPPPSPSPPAPTH